MPTNTIYIASKVKHAPRWRALRDSGTNIISTWIDEAEPGQTANLANLWWRCVTEAKFAHATIVFADHSEAPEVLKGALVEVGAALGNDRRVFAVGLSDSDGSWLNHPLVRRCSSIEEAVDLANVIPYWA